MAEKIASQQGIQNLLSFANRLLEIANRALQSHPSFNDTKDHLSFMALCFVSAQIEHLDSIVILVGKGQHRDAELVARSMIEGLFLLKWAAGEAAIRPFRWRAYSWVQDFQRLEEEEESGRKIEPSLKTTILEQLKIYGPQFFTEKAKKCLSKGLPFPPKPYQHTWYGDLNLWDICKEVKGELLYKNIYRETSEWIHWTPRGLGKNLEHDEGHVNYARPTDNQAYTALASGFQALLESLSLLNNHLGLGLEGQLKEMFESCLETMKKEKR